jgi:hypothetical protein
MASTAMLLVLSGRMGQVNNHSPCPGERKFLC